MKNILFMLFLTACATDPSKFVLKPGQKFDEIKQAKANPPSKCKFFEQNSYCLWDEQILYFKNDIYQSTLEAPLEPTKYKLAAEGMSSDEKPVKTVFIRSGNKSSDNTDWNRYLPPIKMMLIENGYKVVDKIEESEQVIRVIYNVKEMEGGNLRYLNMTSYKTLPYIASKKESNNWKIITSSWGTGKKFDTIFPILLFAVNDFLENPSSGTSGPTVDEGTFEVIVFKHNYGIR